MTDIYRKKLELEETRKLSTLLSRIAGARRWLATETARAEEALHHAAQELAGWLEFDGSEYHRTSYTAAAVILTLLGIPLQAAVCASGISALSVTTWWLLAPVVVLALEALTHYVALAVVHDPTRPDRSIRLLRRTAAWTGVVSLILGAILLLARTAPPQWTPFLANAVPVSLWGLAELLPITAGLLGAAAHVLWEPDLKKRSHRRAVERVAALKGFDAWLTAKESSLSKPGDPGAVDHPSDEAAPAALKLASFLLAAGILGLRPGIASAQPPSAGAPLTDSTVSVCGVFFDATSSVNQVDIHAAAERLAPLLPDLVRAGRCNVLRVGTFADEGAFAPYTDYNLPSPPLVRDCAHEDLALPEGVSKTVLVFASANEYYKKRTVQRCALAVRDQRNEFEKEMETALTQARKELLRQTPVRGTCTDLNRFLAWATTVSTISYTLAVTDGAESCAKAERPLSLPEGARVGLVLVPSVGPIHQSALDAADRADRWKRAAHGIQILFATDLTRWRVARVFER
jgi:hypothetical protein